MSRKINSPGISVSKQTQAVNAGGTGVMNIGNAAAALQLVTNSMRNQPNGVITLDANGKLPSSAFPSGNGINVVSLKGPLTAISGQIVTYTIMGYDAFRTYTISASAGTLTRVGKTLTFVAPPGAQNVTLTINGVNLSVAITPIQPQKPSITSPVNGATGLTASVSLTGNAFVPVGDASTHFSSDWQIATNASFTTIVASTINDTTNKTSWTATLPTANTTYYARVRYKGTNTAYSAYSSTSTFTTKLSFTTSTEEAKLLASDPAVSDNFGISTAMSADGSRVVIGAYNKSGTGGSGQGAMYVFLRTGTSWTQEAKLLASDPATTDRFGYSVSITADSTRVAVGAYAKAGVTGNGQGAVYVFLRTGTSWTQEAKLLAADPAASDQFGISVSLSSDGLRLAAGSQYKTTTVNGQGAVYVFLRTGTTWAQESKLVASNPAVNDGFGTSVSMTADGSRVVIGAPYKSVAVTQRGVVYVFLRTGANWTEEANLMTNDSAQGDGFGTAVSITADGSRVVSCSYSKTITYTSQGAAYVFLRTGVTWTQEARLLATDAAASDYFGYSVSITADGSHVAIGAYTKTTTVNGQGAVYVFLRTGTTWTQESKSVASDPAAGDVFGNAVSFAADGSRIAIGAYQKKGSVSGQGAVYINS